MCWPICVMYLRSLWNLSAGRGVIQNTDANFGGREIRLIMEWYFCYLLPTKLRLISCVWRVYCVADTLSPTLQRLRSSKLHVSENVIWSVDWHITGLRAMWCGECVNGVRMGQDETNQCCYSTWPPSGCIISGNSMSWWSAINVSRSQLWPVWGSCRDIRRYCITSTLKTPLMTSTLAETRTVYETQVAVVSYCVRLTYACLLAVYFVSRRRYT
jgi:hypothetical protein